MLRRAIAYDETTRHSVRWPPATADTSDNRRDWTWLRCVIPAASRIDCGRPNLRASEPSVVQTYDLSDMPPRACGPAALV